MHYYVCDKVDNYSIQCNDTESQPLMIGLLIDIHEIRISNFSPDIRIWKYSYDNRKQSANSQGLRRLPGHSRDSHQLIQ